MSAIDVTSFSYGKDNLIMLFCPRCELGPIILKREVYDMLSEQRLIETLLCRECGAKRNRRKERHP